MKKASTVLLPFVLLGLCAAAIQSCASGETDPSVAGLNGSGGDSGDGSGGGSGDGSGGATGTATGGKVGTASGGAIGTASGGKTGTASGGSTGTATGGAKTGGSTGTSSGGAKTGGTTGTSSGGKVGSGGTTSTTGSGGTVATGSGGTNGGSTTCTKMDATMTVNNGMATNGTWSGYAYTYVGSTPATITPACGTGGTCFMTAAKQLCVSGTVGPDPNFGASAGFGWDIGGTATSGAAGKGGTTTGDAKPAIAPGGTGLNYKVPGITTSMRIQVEDAAGNDYCAAVPTADMGTIPWGMFSEKCYNSPPGTAFSSSTKITSVQIVVPTTSGSMAYAFCFCVVSLGSG